jgi:3-oxoadipate enol-lactonase
MDAIDIQGPAGRLRGWVTGPEANGRLPILYVHPINLQGACWHDVAKALPDRRAVMPDMRGHGGSDPGGPYGLAEWSSDLLAVMDDQGIERMHVIGGSLGGPLAIYLAAVHPDRVASIVAIGAALAIEGDDVTAVLAVLREKGVKGMFREVIPEISVAPGTAPATIDRIIALSNPNDVDTVGAIWGATISSDSTPQAANVRCPALVLTGEYDKTCPPEQGEAMARALHTELEILPGVGHIPMLEAPAQLSARLADWLTAQEP